MHKPALLSFAALFASAPALATTPTHYTIDFDTEVEDSRPGEYFVVSTTFGDVKVSSPDASATNPLNFFDAECLPGGTKSDCSGNDPDLFAPDQGLVLILQDESNHTEADDEDAPVLFEFDFSQVNCADVRIKGFWAIDATDTDYDVGNGLVSAGFGNLEDGDDARWTGSELLNGDVFAIELADSGAIDDIEFECVNPPGNDSFIKFDPAAQSILQGESGFNFHLQMGNPGGMPNAAWPSTSQLVCDIAPIEAHGLMVDVPGVNSGRFNAPTVVDYAPEGWHDALVFDGLAQSVINGQYFDVNIPADTSNLPTGDYELECGLFVPGATDKFVTFELNIRTNSNQNGGPVNSTDTDAYIAFPSSSVDSHANFWYDTLYTNVNYGNETTVTIDGAEIECDLATTGDAEIISATGHGAFSSVVISNHGTRVTFSGSQTLQSYQNRNAQIVIDGLYNDTNTTLDCAISYPNGTHTVVENDVLTIVNN